MPDFSVFTVEKKDVSRVISYINGARFGKKIITIARDKQRNHYSRRASNPRKRNSGPGKNRIKRNQRSHRKKRGM